MNYEEEYEVLLNHIRKEILTQSCTLASKMPYDNDDTHIERMGELIDDYRKYKQLLKTIKN